MLEQVGLCVGCPVDSSPVFRVILSGSRFRIYPSQSHFLLRISAQSGDSFVRDHKSVMEMVTGQKLRHTKRSHGLVKTYSCWMSDPTRFDHRALFIP